MASLALAAAGAAVGNVFNQAALGWAIGSFLGNQFFGPGGQDVEGPRLADLKVQSSAYGAPIPIIYGKARVSGNVIWAKPIRERKIEEDAGSKGSGGSTVTTYEYYGSFAVALCDNEIAGVRKIWADSKLIYNVGDDASLETIQASNRNADKITIHYGTETQEADSLIQADKGAANTQAYRGTAYIVFDDLLLEPYGNRIPNITVEVITEGSVSTRLVREIAKPGANFQYAQSCLYIDDRGGASYVFIGQWSGSYSNTNVKGYKVFSNDTIEEFASFTVGSGVRQALQGRADIPSCAFPAFTFGFRNRIIFYDFSNDELRRCNFVFSQVNGSTDSFAGSNSTLVCRDGYVYVLKASSSDGVRRIARGELVAGEFAYLLGDYHPLEQIQTSNDDLKATCVTMDVDDDYIYVVNSDNTISRFMLNGTFVDHISFTPSPSITYLVSERTPEIVARNSRMYLLTTNYAHEVQENGASNYIGALLVSGITDNFGGTLVRDGVAYLYRVIGSGTYANGGFLAYQLESTTAGSITLSDIVSDLDERAGLDAADDDTSALTDTVEGYVVTRPMSARKAIEPLQQAFFFDACEKDNVLTYVKRGGSVVANIPEDDLGAGDYGQDVDLYTLTRQQDSELPAEVVVDYIDINRSYQEGAQRAQRINSPQENVVKMQLPIVMSADYAKEVAHVLLYNAHTEREQFKLSLTGEYIGLNPTDVITFTADGDTRKARIAKITYGDTLMIEAAAEDATVYSAESTAGDSETTEQTVGLEGPTKLYLMDIPLLRNQDNDAGMYVAASGYFSAWTGAGIFKSLDGGTSYSPVEDVLTASAMGKATTVLADANHTTFDYTSAVTVSLTSGTLSSSTESAVIQGANYALLGTEIIQFVNATDNGDGTYTLSTLLRGRRGTDWATGTHAAGDLFCLLRENVLERVGAVVNTERYYKAVSFGTYLDEAIAQAKTNTGVSQKPFSVKYIAHSRNGSNDISLTWNRRSRYIGTPLWDLPVFEESESYKIEILSGAGGSVVATYTSSSEAYTYTAAQQTSDGFTPGNTIYFNIYQVGAVDGYATEYEAA